MAEQAQKSDIQSAGERAIDRQHKRIDFNDEGEEQAILEDSEDDEDDLQIPEDDAFSEAAVMRVEVTHRKFTHSTDPNSKHIADKSSADAPQNGETQENKMRGKLSISDLVPDQTRPVELPAPGPVTNRTSDSVPTPQTPDRQISELLSSEDEALLLHRPDFYSILSQEDSFEWTFRNEKFSDLDIKFIPSVEKHWSEAKAKSSLKGNTSTTPESMSENIEKHKPSPRTTKSSDSHLESCVNIIGLQETETTRPNVEKVQQNTIKEEPSSTFNILYDRNTEIKKQVTIKVENVPQQDNYRHPLGPQVGLDPNKHKADISDSERKQDSKERHWTKQYRIPFVRENVVFFQSSPTLTYKKTKLKFLESKSRDSSTFTFDHVNDSEDSKIWSSKARLSRETYKPARHKKPDMGIDKIDEFIKRRNVNRKLCKLDDVEAKFISGNASETATVDTPYSPKTNNAADRRFSNPQAQVSSSLDFSINRTHTAQQTSVQNAQLTPMGNKPSDSDKPMGHRRSAMDVIKWLFEGRVSETSRLKRRRSSRDLGQAWNTQRGAGSIPNSLRNWLTFPPRKASNNKRNSFTDRYNKPLKALEYFRRWARIVCLMLKAVGLKPKKPVTSNLDFLSWTVVYDEVLGISRLNYDHGTLTFDPDAYKANRELTIRPEVREILRLSAAERTDAQVKTAMKCLQHVVPAFSEFPVRVQQSMLKVCRHEEFESGRVIIRQGHRAENFYFIVSGSAVVTVMDSGENHVHTANLLGKGSSFGDLAFLNMAKRSATVTCRDTVEVICIERDDFINIFLRGVKGKEPAHFTFLREVDLLKGWPVGALPQDNPRICAYTYVRRGVILSHDSATCDWIVVVVSGTCNIIKAMNDPGQKIQSLSHPSTPQASRKESASPSSRKSLRDTISSPASSTSSYHDNGAENTNGKKNNRKGKLTVRFADFDANDNKSREVTPTRKGNKPANRKLEANRKLRHQLVLADLNLNINRPSSNESLSNGKFDAGLAQEKHLAEIEEIFAKKHVLPAIKKAAQRKVTPAVTISYASDLDRPALTLRRGSDAQNASILRPHRLSTGVQPPPMPRVMIQPPDDDGEEEILKEPSKTSTSSGEKVFIEVAHLETGDVFGLEHVLLGNISDVTSCSLVSAGAEVVLINKKFFLKHLTEDTAKAIREKITPLPSEASLKAQLKAQMSWKAFKADMFTRQTLGQQSQGRSGTLTRQHQVSKQSTVDRGGYRTASQMS